MCLQRMCFHEEHYLCRRFLSDNSFVGPLPEWHGLEIQHLDLSFNGLTQFVQGTVWGPSNSVQQLNLRGNLLIGGFTSCELSCLIAGSH